MKPPVKFGLAAGLLIIAFNLATYFSGNMFKPLGQFAWLISLGIMLPFIALTIRTRRSELGGFIGYRESVKAGLSITLVTGVIYALFTYLFFKLEFAEVYLSEVQKHIVTSKAGREQAVAMMMEASLFTDPFAQATSILFRTVIAGAILSFAAATFLVKKPDAP
jgi:hypothetical protein